MSRLCQRAPRQTWSGLDTEPPGPWLSLSDYPGIGATQTKLHTIPGGIFSIQRRAAQRNCRIACSKHDPLEAKICGCDLGCHRGDDRVRIDGYLARRWRLPLSRRIMNQVRSLAETSRPDHYRDKEQRDEVEIIVEGGG